MLQIQNLSTQRVLVNNAMIF